MKVNILGVGVDNLTFPQFLEKATELARGDKHYLVTPNPEFSVTAQKNEHFREVINRADLSIPDGFGVVWAGRLLGNSLPGRVTGVDLAEGLVAKAADEGLTVFLLGGRGNTAELAARRLKGRFKGLEIVGAEAGEPEVSFDGNIRRKLGNRRIDLLLVAYGHPKQEFWIERNLPHLKVGIALGIGGAFDFWSGLIPRAPKILRSIGMEWFYRLIIQPWRIRRQLSLVIFVWLVFKKRLGKFKRPQEAGAESFRK